MTDVNIFGQIRGTARQYFSSSQQEVQPVLGDGGEQLVSQALPERVELVKLGKSWGAAIPTGSAATVTSGWPGAVGAGLTMQNGEAAGGPSYVVDRVWSADITAGATGPRFMAGQLLIAGTTGTFTDNSAVLKHQLSGRAGNYGGNAKFSVAAANLPIANQWFPLGPSQQGVNVAVQTTVGLVNEAFVYGRIIIPPGAFLALLSGGGSATGTYVLGVEWHEVYLNLG